MSDTPQIIDLDALVPKAVTIKLDGKEIQVNPPTTADILRLGVLGQEMQKAGEFDPVQMEKLVEDINAYLKKLIPEIADHQLNTVQLLKLVQIVSEMGMPPEAREAAESGVTPNSPKKTP